MTYIKEIIYYEEVLEEYKKLSRSKSTFFCFTPMVSLLTFFIEIGFALYVLYQYKLTQFSRVLIGILLMLGIFQLSQYVMCVGGDGQLWSKIGLVSITLLPVLGLHMTTMLTRKSIWTEIGYIAGSILIAIILFFPVPIMPHCTGKFVILDMHYGFGLVYNGYYMFFVFIAIEMLFRSFRNHKGDSKELFWMLISYMSFLIPTVLVYIFISYSRNAMPSIMCGFAIFAAVILVLKELPRFYTVTVFKRKNHKKKKRK